MNPEETPINLVDLIGQLAEPPEPAPISMVPETAGWIVLSVILVLAFAWLIWRGMCRRRANAYRRAALAELNTAGDNPAAIAAILRRTALAAWPREQVANLTGSDWLEFLDKTGGKGGFGDGPGAILLAAPYQSDLPPSAPELGNLAAQWIRHHRVGDAEVAR